MNQNTPKPWPAIISDQDRDQIMFYKHAFTRERDLGRDPREPTAGQIMGQATATLWLPENVTRAEFVAAIRQAQDFWYCGVRDIRIRVK